MNSSSNREWEQEEDRLWINTVPQSVVDKLSKEERKRQENIYELIYTEKDFVEDLAYVNKVGVHDMREGRMTSVLTAGVSSGSSLCWTKIYLSQNGDKSLCGRCFGTSWRSIK